jgi:hypothetical protein
MFWDAAFPRRYPSTSSSPVIEIGDYLATAVLGLDLLGAETMPLWKRPREWNQMDW